MIQVSGTYNKGSILLDETITVDKPVKVIVTFIDDDVNIAAKRLTINDFSFLQSREQLKDVTGNISDTVINERRSLS